jgi:hypothetical protein
VTLPQLGNLGATPENETDINIGKSLTVISHKKNLQSPFHKIPVYVNCRDTYFRFE